MQIQDTATFIDYLEKIRARTRRVVQAIPPDKIEWRPREGKFSCGDLIRHIAGIERYMYAENAQFKPSRYPGHGRELADGYTAVVEYFERAHREAMEIFKSLTTEDLNKKCITPDGAPITLWKWLRAMIEHEIHHRGQIYLYLALMDVSTSPMYGLTSEQVRERSQK